MEPATKMFCIKCRDQYGHFIGRGKVGEDIYRQIKVKEKKGNKYLCRCSKCGHEWLSAAQEAEFLYRKQNLQ